jgi:hypothetical protein
VVDPTSGVAAQIAYAGDSKNAFAQVGASDAATIHEDNLQNYYIPLNGQYYSYDASLSGQAWTTGLSAQLSASVAGGFPQSLTVSGGSGTSQTSGAITYKIMPDGSESVGEAVEVKLTLSDAASGTSFAYAAWGADDIGDVDVSSSVSVTYGGKTTTLAGPVASTDPALTKPGGEVSTTIMTRIGDTFQVGFSFSASGTVGNTNYFTTDYLNPSITGSSTLSLLLQATPGITPTTPTWNSSDGGVDYGFTISGADLPQTTTVDVDWASGPTVDTIISRAVPSATTNTAQGTYNLHASPSQLGIPPKGTKYLLVVADPDNLVTAADPGKTKSLEVSTDIEVSDLGLNFTTSVALGAIEASWMRHAGLDPSSSTFDLEGSVTVTNSGHVPTRPFELTIFASAEGIYDPENDPTFRSLLALPVTSLNAGESRDIPLQGVTNPILLTSGGTPVYQNGFRILAVAVQQGESQTEQPASFDPSAIAERLAALFETASSAYDALFTATHSGMASTGAATLRHYLDGTGSDLEFGSTTATEVGDDPAFHNAMIHALQYAGHTLKGRRHAFLSVEIPQGAVGTPALGEGASTNVPGSYDFDLKCSIHGTQGSSGHFTGRIQSLGKGRRHILQVNGTLTIRLLDVYEFDDSDVYQGGLNVLARALTVFGSAKPFHDAVTVTVHVHRSISDPESTPR